eukprot:1546053-Alexandrium_andersonii.AAC.1
MHRGDRNRPPKHPKPATQAIETGQNARAGVGWLPACLPGCLAACLAAWLAAWPGWLPGWLPG